MKQQDAIDFIQTEMAKARTVKQISADLSQKLGAPQEVVERFVKKVADETVAVDFLTSTAIRTSPAPPVIDPAAFESMLASDQPQARADKQSPHQPVTQTDPQNLHSSSSSAVGLQTADHPSEKKATPKYDLAEIEKFVLQELVRQKNQDDVVFRLSEITGMHWAEAQEIVRRTSARNRKKTTANQNMIVIPLGLIALVAGIILLTAVLKQAASLQTMVIYPASPNPEQIQNLYGSSRQLFWAVLLGVTLGIGGLISLIMAIRKQ